MAKYDKRQKLNYLIVFYYSGVNDRLKLNLFSQLIYIIIKSNVIVNKKALNDT